MRAIDERQKKVISMVASPGVTAFEIAQTNSFPIIDRDVHRFLAISESIAHLDYAESEGKIAVEIKDEVEFYRPL